MTTFFYNKKSVKDTSRTLWKLWVFSLIHAFLCLLASLLACLFNLWWKSHMMKFTTGTFFFFFLAYSTAVLTIHVFVQQMAGNFPSCKTETRYSWQSSLLLSPPPAASSSSDAVGPGMVGQGRDSGRQLALGETVSGGDKKKKWNKTNFRYNQPIVLNYPSWKAN